MPNIRWLLAVITAFHRFIYRISGGRLGGMLWNKPMLLLENVGRKTGQLRETPLLYAPVDGCWIVVGSNMGDDRPPAWWLNLQAKPDAAIQVGPARHAVRARKATDEEAALLWPKLESYYKPYSRYRQATSREIPVVILEPQSA